MTHHTRTKGEWRALCAVKPRTTPTERNPLHHTEAEIAASVKLGREIDERKRMEPEPEPTEYRLLKQAAQAARLKRNMRQANVRMEEKQ